MIFRCNSVFVIQKIKTSKISSNFCSSFRHTLKTYICWEVIRTTTMVQALSVENDVRAPKQLTYMTRTLSTVLNKYYKVTFNSLMLLKKEHLWYLKYVNCRHHAIYFRCLRISLETKQNGRSFSSSVLKFCWKPKSSLFFSICLIETIALSITFALIFHTYNNNRFKKL